MFEFRARGDYTDRSDIDVLVVADDPQNPRKYALSNIDFINVHLIGFNTESFLGKLKEGSVFVLEDGKIS